MSAKRLAVIAVAVVVLALGASACTPMKGPAQGVNFLCTGGTQTWVVPPGVHVLQILALGAAGGDFEADLLGGPVVPGGLGGVASGTYLVEPGMSIFIDVGCAGESVRQSDGVPGQGGFRGGGDGGMPGGAGGGGGSAVGHSTGAFLVAGGGGGAGASPATSTSGGAGGHPAGMPGGTGNCTTAGFGGTQIDGGIAGTGGTNTATAGSFAQGGDGGDTPAQTGGGGGGGSGWFGGGGGCDGGGGFAGGGGGGSSYGLDGTTFATGVWEYDGLVQFNYRAAAS